MDAVKYSYYEFSSMLFRTYGVQQDLCRTSRSVGSPASDVAHRNVRLLAQGNQDKNTVFGFFGIYFNLLGHKESPVGVTLQGPVHFTFLLV